METSCKICGYPASPKRRVTCDGPACIAENKRRVNREQMARYRRACPEIVAAVNQRSRARHDPRRRDERRGKQHDPRELIPCQICGRRFLFVSGRHLMTHGITVAEYAERFPGVETITEAMRESRSRGGTVQAKRNGYDGIPIDDRLRSYLCGAMLGDGALERRKRNARYADGGANEHYMAWKHELLSRYFSTTIVRRLSRPHKKTGNVSIGWFVRTTTHPALTELHELWYDGRKRVPRTWISDHLDAFALAVWFFDDGHFNERSVYLYPMAFAVEDAEWLADLLDYRFGVRSKIRLNGDGRPILFFPASESRRFLEIIRPFIAPGMEYKVALAANNRLQEGGDNRRAGTMETNVPRLCANG